MSLTRPALPKSMSDIADSPTPDTSSTRPSPYLSWVTRSPGSSVISGRLRAAAVRAGDGRGVPNRPAPLTGALNDDCGASTRRQSMSSCGISRRNRDSGIEHRLAPRRAHLGAAQVQPLARPGDADVGQPPFLGQLGGVAERPHVREHAVLPAGDEDDGELQALGGVQRHHRHDARAVLGQFVGVGHQRHPLQELGEHTGVGDVLVERPRPTLRAAPRRWPGRC